MPDWLPEDKDRQLRIAFSDLRDRGINGAWIESDTPFSLLESECRQLIVESRFRSSVDSYLRRHTIVRRAVEMLFTAIAMSARADWEAAPEDVRGIAARGWFLGRWLPTFLVIDGPVGRFLNADDSPFFADTTDSCPALTSAREFMQHRDFRLLRNGLAHWSFHWEVVGIESYIVAYDPDRDLPTVKLHQREADAFHIGAFSLIETLHDTMLKPLR